MTACAILLFAISCSNGSFRSGYIVIYGDTRNGHEVHRALIDAILPLRPEAVFHTGDLVWNGLDARLWAVFNEIVSPLERIAPLYPALGNHEFNSSLYYDNFELPGIEQWYSVTIGDIHCIVLDSNAPLVAGSEQHNWLTFELQESVSDYIILVYHHPLFTSGPHPPDESGFGPDLLPLFSRYKVSAVFNGHNHGYEKSFYNGTFHIVTAGGGAPLYDPTLTNDKSLFFKKDRHFCRLSTKNNALLIEAISIDGTIFDRTEIPKARR